MSILIFFIILLVLVIVHELGHFLTAKGFGVRVDEFGFGFPPKIVGKKIGETEYSLNALPFGGFVKIYGENPDEENTNGPDSERSMVNKAKWKQALILFAGIFANFILAWLLFSFGFMSGLPTSVGSEPKGAVLEDVRLVVVSTMTGSPAEKAGLKSGDRIISVSTDESSLSELNPDSLKKFIVGQKGKEMNVEYTRGADSKVQSIKIKPEISNGIPVIGISMDEVGTAKLSFFGSLYEGLRLDLYVTKNTVVGLYNLARQGLVGKANLSEVTGPVGLVGIVGDAYKFGFSYLLSLAGLISVNLAIINLVPFPALDGGRLLFLLIEKIKGSRINPKVANMVNMIGFGALILLMLFITYHDITKLF